jgi:hypothetical protein
MRVRKYLVALGACLACALVVPAGSAFAAFPDFTGCPTEVAGVGGCVNVQNTSGNLRIKEFNVPLGASLEIRGGIIPDGDGGGAFVPARGTNGFISRPVPVPGGLLGIDWIPGNSVLAITELAGDSDDIRFDFASFGLSVPVKVRLVNTLLGMDCHIGTNSRPVVLNLITGTTSPPPPNRPITGRVGTTGFIPPNIITVTNNLNVENSFAVPGASSCGLGLGLINSLVNLRLGLPSAAGNNSIDVVNNIALLALS